MRIKKRGKRVSLKSRVFLFFIISLLFVVQGTMIQGATAYWSSTNPETEGITPIDDITILSTPNPDEGYYYLVVEDSGYGPCGSEENPGCVYFEVIEENQQNGMGSEDDGIRYSNADYYTKFGYGFGESLQGWVTSPETAIARFSFTNNDLKAAEDNEDNDKEFEMYFNLNGSVEAWNSEDTYEGLEILNVKYYEEDEVENYCSSDEFNDYNDYDNPSSCKDDPCDDGSDSYCEEGEFLNFYWGYDEDSCTVNCSVDLCEDVTEGYEDYTTKENCEEDPCGYESDVNCPDNYLADLKWNESANEGEGECQSNCIYVGEKGCKVKFEEGLGDAECYFGNNCNLDCQCISGSNPTGDGDCETIDCSPDNQEDDCWVQGDLCYLNNCTCMQGDPNENNGGCDGNAGCFAGWEEGGEGSSECFWGDNCNWNCECIGGSIPKDDGSCTSIDCSFGNDCWVQGDECNLTSCSCYNDLEPYLENEVKQGYCTEGGLPGNSGTCRREQYTTDDCADGMLNYSWNATVEWSEGNKFEVEDCSDEECCQENFEEEYPEYYMNFTYDQGACRYDPDNLMENCVDGSDVRECPTGSLVPFFSSSNFIVVLLVIGGIYFFFWKPERIK